MLRPVSILALLPLLPALVLALLIALVAPSARAQNPQWSDAEKWAFGRFVANRLADFNDRCGTTPDPREPAGWNAACREISPGFVQEVLTGKVWTEQVGRRGVRLRGAHIRGTIDLGDAEIAPELWLDASRVEGDVNLSDAHLKHLLSLDGSTVTGSLLAYRVRVDSTVTIQDKAAIEGDVQLGRAVIQGTLGMSGASVGKTLNADGMSVDGSVFMRDHAAFHGDVNIRGARIGATLELVSSSFDKPVAADAIDVSQGVFLGGHAVFKGGLTLHSARIGGTLEMDTASFGGPIDADKADIHGSVFMRNHTAFEGDVILRSARIGSNLEMDASSFDGTMSAENADIGGSVFMRDHATFRRDVVFRGARVGGTLEMDTSSFGGGINLNAAKVRGSVYMREGASFAGEIALLGATVDGYLVMDNSTYDGAIDGESLSVHGPLFIRFATIGGTLDLWHARVGYLDLRSTSATDIDLTDLEASELRLSDMGWRCRPGATAAPADPGTPPRLVVVIDEFRVLADELPDLLGGLARLAAQGRSLGVHLLLATQRPSGAVPPDLRAEPMLMLDHAAWLRRRERLPEAHDLWLARGAEAERAADAGDLAAFWGERNLLARRLLRAGDDRGAYEVVDRRGATAPEQALDAEFLAGFVALRRLHDPAAAVPHFQALAAASGSALTQSRAHYWLGRAAAAAGGDPVAEYRLAAAWPVTFYGQLAALAIDHDPVLLATRIRAARDPAWSRDQALDFAGTELARAAALLVAWGDPRRAHAFLLRADEQAAVPAQRALAAHFAAALAMPDMAVAIARRMGRDGGMLPEAGWPQPLGPQPLGPPAAGKLDPALVLALIRQESSFDPAAVSPSGARGLMQLMPATAQAVARQNGEPLALPALTEDPRLNVRLGTAYLAGLVTQFGGALPLAFAGYNAGPSRVQEWLAVNGDPRARDDAAMIDWIELIPFNETRNYVQRVLENAVVYRARAGDTPLLPGWTG
jgi:soluble lytic murein transglycosylase-like protein/cytoskeletal protein CcmA (bactofilin family)